MADFGNAVVLGQGQSTFDETCESTIDLTLTEQVILSALVPLSEAQAQEGAFREHGAQTYFVLGHLPRLTRF
jgi:hypothetical protein